MRAPVYIPFCGTSHSPIRLTFHNDCDNRKNVSDKHTHYDAWFLPNLIEMHLETSANVPC